MSRKMVVVVFGNKGNGKDAFGDALAVSLRAHRGLDAEAASFADPLKEAAHHFLGIPRAVLWGDASVKEDPKNAIYGETVRKWLQWLGTDVGRKMVHPDVWVHRFGDACLYRFERGMQVVVCRDGRFLNEREELPKYLKQRDPNVIFKSIAIWRPSVKPDLTHDSEREVFNMIHLSHQPNAPTWGDQFDYKILNDGTLADLSAAAKNVSREIALELEEIDAAK